MCQQKKFSPWSVLWVAPVFVLLWVALNRIKIMAEEEEEIMMMEEEEEEDMSTTFLPQEIVMDILSRLPAESLVSSFKLVCKAWRTLIQDPDFIKMHLSRGGASIDGGGGERRSLIRKPKIGNSLFQLHPPRLNCDKPPFIFEDLPIAVATNLDFDFDLLLPSISRDASSSRLVGSCNGLLCLTLDYNERIVLLNPSTRKYKVSPKEPIECPNGLICGHVTYGFGCFHDFTTTIDDEYKVVRIAYFYSNDADANADDDDADDDDDLSNQFQIDRLQIDIYSMSSNSWRRVKDIPPHKKSWHRSLGVFLNGIGHWIGCNHGYPYLCDTIVSFNMGDEEFRQLPMAPCVDVVFVNEIDDVILMNWRGYLGMIYCSRTTERMDIDLEIWVMKEYGIGESWTKEFMIRTSSSDPPRELPAGFSIKSRCIMTCFWTGDQILIQGKYLLVAHHEGSSSFEWRVYGRLVLYDMNRKNISKDVLMADIPSEPRDEQVDYIDTLVSLKSSLLPLNKQ